MKKILLAVTAALAITSCSQNEEFENVGQNAEISFGTIVRNSTRANILTTDNMQTFTVSGYQTDAEMAEGTKLTTGFIDELKVEKKMLNGCMKVTLFIGLIREKFNFWNVSRSILKYKCCRLSYF